MRAIVAILMILQVATSFAQERCATNYTPANQYIIHQSDQFESWISEMRNQKKELRQFQSARSNVVYTIPVVFHIIHNGESIGTGVNISDQRIQEQIDVLNKDFRRENEDASSTPLVFQPVAADTEINFVLAKQTPEGLPSNGVVRVQGSKTQYNASQDDALLKSESYWPAEDYLNIWVTNLSGNFIGNAQYPFANLPGLQGQFLNYRLTDGLVIDYLWVGINDNTTSFDSYGRTATHELGHYLGLRHIWGDGGCSFDDYCADTPLASGSYSGKSSPCSFPDDQRICSEGSPMFQNFMDYTDDECMNLFTFDQKERMRLVLEYSPRRKSLLTSPGLVEPVQFTNDLGVRTILSPEISDCDGFLDPSIEIRNYGTNNITSFSVGFYINNQLVETVNELTNLNPLDVSIVNFGSVSINQSIFNEVEFRVNSVNGVADNNQVNNIKSLNILPNETSIIPFFEEFEGQPKVTMISEFGETSNWKVETAPDNTALNKAAKLKFYNSQDNIGSLDLMLTKVLDLSNLSTALLSFKYAYAPRSDSIYNDGLIVAISTDCGANFPVDEYLFEKYGTNLGTVLPRSQEFTPMSPFDWEEEFINLTPFIGTDYVQIAFIGVNGGGNNLYVDSIAITSDNLLAYDVGIRQISNVSQVTCYNEFVPLLEVKNYGYETVDNLLISYDSENGSEGFQFSNLNLLSGASTNLVLQGNLKNGLNQNEFEVISVNQRVDEYAPNNKLRYFAVLNEDEESIPVRQNFEFEPWVINESSNDPDYEKVLIGENNVLKAKAFNSSNIGTESWLVSPTLSTDDYKEAGLRFRVSYASNTQLIDNLKILLSTNCGLSYDKVIYNKNSDSLAVTVSSTEWEPQSDEDWRTEYLSLTNILQLADEDKVENFRLAFVFTNGTGNNLYLDDIEILTIDDPDLQPFNDPITIYPNPSPDKHFKVAFNLKQKEEVNIQLVDLSGRIVYNDRFSQTLNQIYEFVAPSQSGFYFVRITGQSFSDTKRLFIRQ
ncbi:MAG: choice-of-anchor J domain-containing protein [Cyclobacteriaceae bacterium]